MITMHVLAALAFFISVAALPANYPESSDLSPHPDKEDQKTLEPQAPAANPLSLQLAKDAGFTAELEDTDLSAAPKGPRDSRSPHKYQNKGQQYRPQVQHYQPQVQHYQPQVQHYQPQVQHYQPQPVKQVKVVYQHMPAQQYTSKGGKGGGGKGGGGKGHKG